jgi:hypothetical protein
LGYGYEMHEGVGGKGICLSVCVEGSCIAGQDLTDWGLNSLIHFPSIVCSKVSSKYPNALLLYPVTPKIRILYVHMILQ